MKEEIETRQRFARDLVKVNEGSFTYGFLEEYGLNAIEKAETVLHSETRSDVRSESRGETVVYNFLETANLLQDVSENYYRIKFTEKEIELFKTQLKQRFEETYDKYELIAYLQVHSERLNSISDEEKSATVDYFDALGDKAPSQTPYCDKFGSFSWALHVAGLENREENDREIVEDLLRREIHRKNENTDLIFKTLSASDIKESELLPEKLRDKPYFDSTEDAYKKSGFGTVRKIESEMKEWKRITSEYSEIEEIDEYDLRIVY